MIPLWEVFIRSRNGLNHKHVGSLHAADAEMALQAARDIYTRREEGNSIWVVQSSDITASDPGTDDPALWVLVELLSVAHRHRLSIKTEVPKERPVLPSATAVYRAAQWHERECMEMYGIRL